MAGNEISGLMIGIVMAWIGLLVVITRSSIKSPDGSAGLPIAFVFAMTFQYIGAASYVVPGYTHLRGDGHWYLQSYGYTDDTALMGSLAALLGLAGFAIGCVLYPRGPGRAGAWKLTMPKIPNAYRQMSMRTVGVFGVAGFLITYFSLDFALAQAIGQVGRNAAISFVCLGAALAVLVDRKRSAGVWLGIGIMIPAIYLLVWGFTSYGFLVFSILSAFWIVAINHVRRSMFTSVVGGIAVVYIFLTLFISWMTFRDELRQVLWSDAGVVERVGAITTAAGNSKFLDPTDYDSLDLLNIRLNQYIFVGKAIEYHEKFPDLSLNGQSIYLAFLAWVPRFLWPGKPEMGGSKLISEHTGMRFSEEASFGAGPVFELYVNFAYVGVFCGFIVLGLLMRGLDSRAIGNFRKGDLLGFIMWFTVGTIFVNPLSDFFFTVNTALITFAILFALRTGLSHLAVIPKSVRLQTA